jgi:hypothetical protein
VKAITCPQCGALIKKISLRDKFAFCDYCTAKILLPEDKGKLVEDSDETGAPQMTPYQQYLKTREENARKYAAMNPPVYNPTDDDDRNVWKVFLVVTSVILLVIFFGVTGRSCLDRPFNSTNKTVAASKTPAFTSTPFPLTESTVYPRINYSVDVKWTGSDDMEHYEMPSIDVTKLPTADTKQLKKTVFANRSVQVKVTIDENGEVSEAKAISGHPILKEAAENAARKTLFSNRPKPTNRVLTYVFRLTEE